MVVCISSEHVGIDQGIDVIKPFNSFLYDLVINFDMKFLSICFNVSIKNLKATRYILLHSSRAESADQLHHVLTML